MRDSKFVQVESVVGLRMTHHIFENLATILGTSKFVTSDRTLRSQMTPIEHKLSRYASEHVSLVLTLKPQASHITRGYCENARSSIFRY